MSSWTSNSSSNASDNASESDYYEADYDWAADWTLRSLWPRDAKIATIAAAFVATCGFACAGNALVIATLVQQRHMRTVTNTLLLNQSLVDLLLALICMPVSLIGKLMQNFIFASFVCPVVLYLQGLVVAVSAFTLTVLSWERFAAICRPLSSRRWQTMKHTYQCIAGVWLLAALLASPIAVHARVVELRPGLRKCGEIWSSAELEIAYSITLDVALFGVPLAVMGLTYTLIAVHLTRSLRFASGMANSGASGSGGGDRQSPASSFGSRGGYLVATESATLSGIGEAQRGAEHQAAGEAREALAPERTPTAASLKRRMTPSASPPIIALTIPCILPVPKTSNNAGRDLLGGGAGGVGPGIEKSLEGCDESPKLVVSRTSGGHMRRERLESLASPGSERTSYYLSASRRRTGAPPASRQCYLQSFVTNRRKVIRMIIVVIAEFFVCWCPIYTLQTWSTIDFDSARLWVPPEAQIVLVLLGFSSAACHPITYCFMNRNFRDGFLRVFHLRSNTLNGAVRPHNGVAAMNSATHAQLPLSAKASSQRFSACGSFIAHASGAACSTAARNSAHIARARTPSCGQGSLSGIGTRSAAGTCQSSFVSTNSTRSTSSCIYSGLRSLPTRRELAIRNRTESLNAHPPIALSPDCAA